MKETAVSHKPGNIIELAGIRFVVLADFGQMDVEDKGHDLFILSLESQGVSSFGDTNNYAESHLKKAVDDWLYRLTEKLDEEYGCNCNRIKRRVIDLTTVDGYKGFGSLEVSAAPLTMDEARKYADIIPNCKDVCWLVTGWGGPEHFGSPLALSVNSGGGWNYFSCSYSYGIRPALVISSLLLDSEDEPAPDLSAVPTDSLMAELQRRLKN